MNFMQNYCSCNELLLCMSFYASFYSVSGTFHPLYLRFQSPPDISNLNNDSVEKGSK